MTNQKEDGIAKLAGEPLSLQADGNDTSQKKTINFYKNFADPKPAWTLSLNPRVDPNNAATAKPGWSIGDADGNRKCSSTRPPAPGARQRRPGLVPAERERSGAGQRELSACRGRERRPAQGRRRLGDARPVPGRRWREAAGVGCAVGQKSYLGFGTSDCFVEGGTGNGYFKGKVGIGATDPKEALEVNGRAKLGPLTVGPWPANGNYVFFGANTLDQTVGNNYALMQGGAGAMAVEDPHLLQLSGIGAPEHLRDIGVGVVHARPNVGQNLSDHYAR